VGVGVGFGVSLERGGLKSQKRTSFEVCIQNRGSQKVEKARKRKIVSHPSREKKKTPRRKKTGSISGFLWGQGGKTRNC